MEKLSDSLKVPNLKIVEPDSEAQCLINAESEWLESVGVGLRMRELLIDPKLIPDECRHWLVHWHEGAAMILAGNVGAGKTVAAVFCLRMLYRVPGRRRCKFVKARELHQAVFDRDHLLLRSAKECDVLVIDEWGGAYASEWPAAEMDGLIDARWESKLATIVTTNLHPTEGDSCLKITAPRAYDRLCDEPGPGVVIVDRASMRGAPIGDFLEGV